MRVKNRTLRRQREAHMPKSPDGTYVRIKTERRGVGKIKTMGILLIALLQLALIICLHTLAATALRWYMIFSVVMDIFTCLYILASSKNSRSKAVWIMIVLILFPVGFLIFFLSDERIFFRSSRKRYERILASSAGMLTGCTTADMPESTARACTYLENATGYVPYKNTTAEYFPSGASAFDDMLEKCAAAEKFIFIEYFIIAEGALFKRMFSVLAERAAAGVDVRVIYDDMGSGGRISHKVKKRVRAAGIQMCAFNKLVPLYKIGMNYRDHRKITVIDGLVAYTGGINIADEYVNEKRLYGYWKDNAVRLEGDAVQGFTLMFLRQWEFVTRKTFDYSPYLYAGEGKFAEPVSSEDSAGAIESEDLSDGLGDPADITLTENLPLPESEESPCAAEENSDTLDTTAEVAENADTPDTAEPAETAETSETAETADSFETAETAETTEHAEAAQTAEIIKPAETDGLTESDAGDERALEEGEEQPVQTGAGQTTVATEAERIAAEGGNEKDASDEIVAEESAPRRGGVFLPYAAGLEYRDPVVRDVYAGVISQANERLWIMTPYFVPDDTITNLLASKARSGVDVRIVLPGIPDKGFVYLISLDNADRLTQSGVKVYTMSDAFVHTKSVLTEKCAVIGSANFDLRSFFQQYENALYSDDDAVMQGLELDFENTFPECVQRTLVREQAGLVRTLLTAILQIFAPMM